METSIFQEAGPSYSPPNYFNVASRRSMNPVCRDVQATLSSFSFSAGPVNTAAATSALNDPPFSFPLSDSNAVQDDEYVEPSCIMDASSRRPSVQRTSSAPEPSSSKPTMFVETSGPSASRPSLARACSESRASGVLERRRCKVASSKDKLPSKLILDLADLPMTMGAGNLGLLRAARKAISEPSGFDWGRTASSAPASSANNRFITQQQQQQRQHHNSSLSADAPAKVATTVSLPASRSASTSASPESQRVGSSITSSRSCFGSHWSARTSTSNECEWDWALAGNARATHEALRFSAYKETKEPVHDIWHQLPDWVSRRSSVGGRDADLSLRGPAVYNSLAFKAVMDQAATTAAAANAAAATAAALSLSLANASISTQSPRNSLSGRGRASKLSVHVPFRVIEEAPPQQSDSISPRGSISL